MLVSYPQPCLKFGLETRDLRRTEENGKNDRMKRNGGSHSITSEFVPRRDSIPAVFLLVAAGLFAVFFRLLVAARDDCCIWLLAPNASTVQPVYIIIASSRCAAAQLADDGSSYSVY